MRAMLQTTTAVLALAAICSTALGQSAMPWQPNLETAQRLANQTNRLVLIHFWAPWCRPCMRLEHEVFSRRDGQGVGREFRHGETQRRRSAGHGAAVRRVEFAQRRDHHAVGTVGLPDPKPADRDTIRTTNEPGGRRTPFARAEAGASQDAKRGAARLLGCATTEHRRHARSLCFAPSRCGRQRHAAAATGQCGCCGKPNAGGWRSLRRVLPARANSQRGGAPPADNRVTPAQAYAAAGTTAAATQAAPVDPYAGPAQSQATAPPGAAAPPAYDPYAGPAADPYAAPQAAAAPPAANPYPAAPTTMPYHNPRAPSRASAGESQRECAASSGSSPSESLCRGGRHGGAGDCPDVISAAGQRPGDSARLSSVGDGRKLPGDADGTPSLGSGTSVVWRRSPRPYLFVSRSAGAGKVSRRSGPLQSGALGARSGDAGRQQSGRAWQA